MAKLVDHPRMERREMQVLTPEQVPAFLDGAREDRWAPLWELLLTTGMRPVEALGLRWRGRNEDARLTLLADER